jgi:hypothetical protein
MRHSGARKSANPESRDSGSGPYGPSRNDERGNELTIVIDYRRALKKSRNSVAASRSPTAE